eukprot:TRINITY_DN6413_c1_g1_i1.p1 TRINITY_DN6413_c1_g1~~TRINITY_DN6413_c1_g1_i1.p1  ORF type:complete len:286 (-),score=23.24 TRINITY_DN6413_c1_g1_i1:312-1169(-)
MGLFLNSLVYRTFIVPVLSFVMQLGPSTCNLEDEHRFAMRCLVPGPGNWISIGDLEQLKSAYRFPLEFQNLRYTNLAVKLRVIHDIVPDLRQKCRELELTQADSLRRPFGTWHYGSLFSALLDTVLFLESHGVTVSSVNAHVRSNVGVSFQTAARELIIQRVAPRYFPLARIRAKLVRWRLDCMGDLVDRRVLRNFAVISDWCHPKIFAAYLRTLWNGWPTERRMQSLFKAQGHQFRGCVFGCCGACDSVEHYLICAANNFVNLLPLQFHMAWASLLHRSLNLLF